MPRPAIHPDVRTFEGSEREAYERVYRRFSQDPEFIEPGPPYFASLLNSPRFAELLSEIGTLGRLVSDSPGSFSHADREFIDQVLSYDFDFYAFQGIHTPDAIKAGVRPAAIEAIRDGRDADLTDDERLLATFIRSVASGTVTDEVWEAMEQRLGTRGVVEYAVFIAFIQLTIRLFQAFDSPGTSKDDVRRLLDSYLDGSAVVPSTDAIPR